jgi:NAD(P)-dependent dehydrogenase (short-subunit alcohol dehydrogenase family)
MASLLGGETALSPQSKPLWEFGPAFYIISQNEFGEVLQMSQQKVVLVTGASSGIGRAIATLLQQTGYRVFGSKLPSEAIPQHIQFESVDLDVTDEDSVLDCVEYVINKAGRLDVLVNNAGIAFVGAVEETTLEEAHWQMEVNFYGLVRMTKAVLPHMRQRQSGTIINISSLLGVIGSPYSAFYVASKHAVEGFSKSLRYELKPFNIQVSMIEPGFVKTELLAHGHHAADPMPAYADLKARMVKVGDDNLKQGFSPKIVAQTVKQIIESPAPRLSYPLFIDPLSRMTGFLPAPLRDRVVYQLMGIYDPSPDLPKIIGGAVVAVLGLLWWLRPRHE